MTPVTLTAENTWTNPIFVGRDELYVVDVLESTATLSARFTIQVIWLDPKDDITRPDTITPDSRWRAAEKFDVNGSDPVQKVSTAGGGWFRTGIATGDYTSGEADVEHHKVKK